MIISRTPLRLSFLGGGTDYNEYFERCGGAVLGTTIDKYIYISVNKLSDFFEYNVRVGYSKAELVKNVDEIVHPSVRETLKYKKINHKLDIHIFADLPAKTGLGASSAFTVGLLNALYALEGKTTSKQQLAKEAIYIEKELIKENIGCQDQFHAAYGGFNIIEFSKSSISVRPIVISKEKMMLLSDSLMVFYSGLTRYATEIVEEQIINTKKHLNDSHLKRMHKMVFEAEQIISDQEPDEMLESFGKLLQESWSFKKCLSSQITNTLIDDIYRRAIAAGAYGGKLGGAGGGGFLFFLVPEHKQESVRNALSDLLEVKFQFESTGSSIIYLTH